MPNPRKGESEQNYVSRFVGSAEAKKSFPNRKQRLAVAYSKSRHREDYKKKR